MQTLNRIYPYSFTEGKHREFYELGTRPVVRELTMGKKLRMPHILYADVKYSSVVYTDAQLFDGKWFFEDTEGDAQTFALQHLVKPINEPTPYRRHPPEMSGRILSSSKEPR